MKYFLLIAFTLIAIMSCDRSSKNVAAAYEEICLNGVVYYRHNNYKAHSVSPKFNALSQVELCRD